jgi:cytochrome P450
MRANWPALFVKVREEMGNIARVRFGPVQTYFVYDPAFVSKILTKHASKYANQTRGYKKLSLLLGQGLVTSEGDFWKRQRRIAQPAFHRERIAGFVGTMAQATADLVDKWDAIAAENGEVEASQAMMELTLRIAGETLFSTDISSDTSEFGNALSYVLEHFNFLVGTPLPYPEYLPLKRNWDFWRAMKILNRVAWDIIQQRRESNEDKGDLLSMLMLARDEETGEGMSDQQLRDEVFTMLSAGHETTANALAWTLSLLAQHPDIAERVAEENTRLLGDRLPTASELKTLTYTEQVFKESMRLYPPVWCIARKAIEHDKLGEYDVRPGQFVFFSQYAIHRHPDHWNDPNTFDPDRFSKEAMDERKQYPHWRYTYFPFSRGQRQCIGDQFAMMEGLTVLSILVRRFRFALAPHANLVPEHSVTLRPKYGVPLLLQPR